ncbi:hypothetical protein D3C84_789080 [compost metagenome]
MGFGVAVEVLNPGAAARRVREVGNNDGRVLAGEVVELRLQHPRHAIAIPRGQVGNPGRNIEDGIRQHIPRRRGVVIVEADDVVGRRVLMRIVHAQRRQVEGRAVECAEHRVILITDVQHFIGAALRR